MVVHEVKHETSVVGVRG